jgi:hypothetical protein
MHVNNSKTKKETVMFEQTLSRNTFIAVLAATGIALAGCGNKPSAEQSAPPVENASEKYTITTKLDPNPPTGGKENTIHVTVLDGNGKPVPDAQVHLTLTMPAMPEMKMPEMKNSADLPWTGSDYSGPVQIMMAGGWTLDVEARRGDKVLAKDQTHLNAK